MRNIYIYISLISLSLFSQNVILEIDTNSLRIGEQFNLKVKVYDLKEEDIVWPSFDTFFQDVELIKDFPPSLYFDLDTHVYKNYLLTSFDTGKFLIDSIPVLNSLNDTVFSNALSISFLPIALDTTNQFFDIKPPKKIPFLARELLFYLPYFLFFLFIILAIFLYAKYFNKNKNPQLTINKPSIPIDVYFLSKLSDLQKKEYLKNEKYKDFYTELSEIFRGYLELRFNIPALESSTHELKGLLSNLKIEEKWLGHFFRNNDIVKFAKGIPSKKDSLSFLENIKSFIIKFGILDDDLLEKNKIKE